MKIAFNQSWFVYVRFRMKLQTLSWGCPFLRPTKTIAAKKRIRCTPMESSTQPNSIDSHEQPLSLRLPVNFNVAKEILR